MYLELISSENYVDFRADTEFVSYYETSLFASSMKKSTKGRSYWRYIALHSSTPLIYSIKRVLKSPTVHPEIKKFCLISASAM